MAILKYSKLHNYTVMQKDWWLAVVAPLSYPEGVLAF
jgi:hypothetical protein